MNGINALLSVARAYGSAEGIELATVSSRACKDGKKLPALESGADITVSRLEDTMRWFSVNWPDGAVWPAEVPRPREACQ